jgi:hypothetical protein
MGSLCCCEINTDSECTGYSCCRTGYPHICTWTIWIPICLIIGLPCLLVGVYQYSPITENNQLIKQLYNAESVIQHNTTYYQFAATTNCRVPPAQLNTTSYPQCASINMRTKEPTCVKRGNCVDEVCDSPCYYQCDSTVCKVASQQPNCITAMKGINCLVHFDLISTTYSCVIKPMSAMPVCEKECSDINCVATQGKCYCKCRKYEVNICDITKNVQLTHKQYFMNEKEEVNYKTDVLLCSIANLDCMDKLNKLINTTYPATPIYFNQNDPTINTLSVDDLLQTASSQTWGLLISGGIFTGVGVIWMLVDLYMLLSAWLSCRWIAPKCCRKKPLADQVDEPLCGVCNISLLDGNKTQRLACKHVLHASCVQQRGKHGNTCPICNKSINAV